MRLPDPRSQQWLFLQELLGTRLAFGFNSPASFLAPFAITGARAGPKAVQGTVSALWKLAADRGPGTQGSSGDPHWGRSFQLLAGYWQAVCGFFTEGARFDLPLMRGVLEAMTVGSR